MVDFPSIAPEVIEIYPRWENAVMAGDGRVRSGGLFFLSLCLETK
jgi:hypothetical protein